MIDTKQCIFCTDTKDWVFSHMRGDCRIYKDLEGKEWSGNRCPECYLKYKRAYDAERRLKKGHDVMDTIRLCVRCSGQMTVSLGKHKTCLNCRQTMKPTKT